jgi:hypothetical protein
MIKYNEGVPVDSQWTPMKLPQGLDGGLPVQSLKSHESPWDSPGSPLGVPGQYCCNIRTPTLGPGAPLRVH